MTIREGNCTAVCIYGLGTVQTVKTTGSCPLTGKPRHDQEDPGGVTKGAREYGRSTVRRFGNRVLRIGTPTRPEWDSGGVTKGEVLARRPEANIPSGGEDSDASKTHCSAIAARLRIGSSDVTRARPWGTTKEEC